MWWAKDQGLIILWRDSGILAEIISASGFHHIKMLKRRKKRRTTTKIELKELVDKGLLEVRGKGKGTVETR